MEYTATFGPATRSQAPQMGLQQYGQVVTTTIAFDEIPSSMTVTTSAVAVTSSMDMMGATGGGVSSHARSAALASQQRINPFLDSPEEDSEVLIEQMVGV
jgi:hypothetical protein